jgi:hypothetical protein
MHHSHSDNAALPLHVILLLQPKEARAGDASDNFARIARFSRSAGGGDEEATTGDEGDRRHLMQN